MSLASDKSRKGNNFERSEYMGTFLGYFGDQTIPEDKREEFTRRVLTILDQGGMLDLEDVSLFGKRIWLLKPPQALPGKDTILFCYNYFEQDTWETGGYEPASCSFHTNKVGWRQFNLVCSAVYVLYEFYTDSFGIASEDAHVYDAREIIGWLNYLFQSRYDNRRASNPWRVYQLLPDYRRDDAPLVQLADGSPMDPMGMLIYLTVTRKANQEALWESTKSASGAPHNILDCISRAERALAELTAGDEESDLKKLEQLTAALKNRDMERLSEGAPQCFAVMAAMLPVEITAKLLADAFARNFWALLEELRSFGWDGGDCWNFKGLPPAEPVAPVDTAAFLRCSDDDRAWWWRPDGDVHFSKEMNAWLAQCRAALDNLAQEEPPMRGAELLELLVGTLDSIQRRNPSVFAFREMFYDFAAHSESPMAGAAVRYLEQLAEQEDAAVSLRRYLAVLGNLPLRERVFGF